jgi:hypothetical protein
LRNQDLNHPKHRRSSGRDTAHRWLAIASPMLRRQARAHP